MDPTYVRSLATFSWFLFLSLSLSSERRKGTSPRQRGNRSEECLAALLFNVMFEYSTVAFKPCNKWSDLVL